MDKRESDKVIDRRYVCVAARQSVALMLGYIGREGNANDKIVVLGRVVCEHIVFAWFLQLLENT